MNAADVVSALGTDPLEQEFARTAEATRAYVEVTDFRGQLEDGAALRRYLEAGNATFTVVSRKTGTRFTFRARRPEPKPNARRPIWIHVLTGADNESAYSFLGTLWETPQWGLTFTPSPKSTVGRDAPSRKALEWLVKCLAVNPAKLFASADVWHEGRCGRCGRKLTVPGSIASGFGPECITHQV